jgi:hypothetical protein
MTPTNKEKVSGVGEKTLSEAAEEYVDELYPKQTWTDYHRTQAKKDYLAGAIKMAELKDAEIKHWKEMYPSTLEQRIRFGVEIFNLTEKLRIATEGLMDAKVIIIERESDLDVNQYITVAEVERSVDKTLSKLGDTPNGK